MKIARTIVGSCLALSLTIPFTASASAASQSEHANAPHVSPVANPLESKLPQTAGQNVKAAGVDAGLNVNVDVLGISDRIAEAVKSDQNRTGWVKCHGNNILRIRTEVQRHGVQFKSRI